MARVRDVRLTIATIYERWQAVYPPRADVNMVDRLREADSFQRVVEALIVVRRMCRSNITVHDFRSSFRDWCAEAVGNSFSREVCEHALAHSLPDRVEPT